MIVSVPTQHEVERGFVPISDDQLVEHAKRIEGKVVIITGAANGIGAETATLFASAGAKLVLGDIDVPSADKVVADIRESGGKAISSKCDVTIWEDQIALFDLAIKTFGSVDVVVASAGVGELTDFAQVKFDSATGKPEPPNVIPVQINLVGIMYTLQLAQHYLLVGHASSNTVPDLKAVVVLGSMASWISNPLAPVDVATRHGILGLVRSLDPTFTEKGIRAAVISSFVSEISNIRNSLPPLHPLRAPAEIRFTPESRCAAAIVHAATRPLSSDGNKKTSGYGSGYLMVDDGPVYEVPREGFKLGVYDKLGERAHGGFKRLQNLAYISDTIDDVLRVIGKPVLVSAVVLGLARAAWIYFGRGQTLG